MSFAQRLYEWNTENLFRYYVIPSNIIRHVGRVQLKPNSITLAGSELAPNMFGASSELASVMEFGREPASSC